MEDQSFPILETTLSVQVQWSSGQVERVNIPSGDTGINKNLTEVPTLPYASNIKNI